MRKKFESLVNRTGASGDSSDVNKQVLRVMTEDKDITAQFVGSSGGAKLKVTGTDKFYIYCQWLLNHQCTFTPKVF